MILPIQQMIDINKETLKELLIIKNQNLPEGERFVVIKQIEFTICERILLEKYFKQENNKYFLEKMKNIIYEMLEYNEKNFSEGFYLVTAEICKDAHKIIEINKNYIIERV